MKIRRNGQEFELTEEELQKANQEFVTNFMRDELLESFRMKEEEAQDVAEIAYELYCDGDGKTEYECIIKAYEQFQEENQNKTS